MILALWSAALFLAPAAPAAPVLAGPQDLFVETRRMLPDPKPSGVRDVAAGDVDGDGDVDLLLGSDGPNLLWRNDLAGLFTDVSAQLPAVDERSYSVLLEDLDGDGDLDVYESDDHAGAIFGRVLENDGSGGFAVALTFVAPQGRPVAGDVDNDGDVDLVIGTTLYRNVGPGLALQVDLAAFAGGPYFGGEIMLADLDGDGDLDAFQCQAFLAGSALVCINDGTGHFATGVPIGFACARASFGDLDGDGDLDAYASVLVGMDAVLFNDGVGGFSAVSVPWASFESLLDDTDGDGDLDVLALSGSAGVLRLANDGTGTLTDASASLPPAVGTTVNLVAADVDGDQDADLITTGGDSAALWLNASGTYVEVQYEPRHQAGGAFGIHVGDLTGDGAPDALFYRGEAPELALLVNPDNGSGILADASALVPAVAPYVKDLDVFDADGDGDSDLLVGHAAGNAELLKNDGTGKLAELPGAVPALVVDASSFPATGDVDGDGDTDVLRSWYTSAPSASATAVWTNDGLGFFTAGGSLYAGSPTYDPGRPLLLDADGDGDLDAFLIGTSLKFASVLLNDGVGGFAMPGLVTPGLHGIGAAAADVNADGAPDVALATNDGVASLINVGAGAFQLQSTLVGPWAGGADVQLVDLDGDGDNDVLWVGAYPSAGGAWMGFRNDGVGAFAYDAAYEQKGLNPRFADLDGDGDLDAVARRYDRLVQLTRVDGGQVAWRAPARIGLPLPMEVFGASGDPFFLAASPGTASFPLAPFGTLLLDPSQIWPVAAGAIPSGGMATVNVPIGNDPALLGLDFFWQALVGVPLRFTNADRMVVGSF